VALDAHLQLVGEVEDDLVLDAQLASELVHGDTICPAADPGLQQVTLTLTSLDKRVSESLVVVVASK